MSRAHGDRWCVVVARLGCVPPLGSEEPNAALVSRCWEA
jgi:hypothetical protein